MRQDHTRLKITLIVLLILVFNFLHYQLSAPLTNLHYIIFRLNYLPIVMAAFWFGWRGGVGAALLITLILLPDLFLFHWKVPSDLNSFLEIFLYNAVGLVTGWLSSAEMRQRQRYNEMVVQLAKAEHLAQLGEMAASLAHEIRNPLQSLKPIASMLETDLKTESRRKELAAILREEVERLNRLVTDFLQFARPKPLLLVETDLNHLVEKTVEIIQLQLSSQRMDKPALEPSTKPALEHSPSLHSRINFGFEGQLRERIKGCPSIFFHLSLMKTLPTCQVDAEQIQQVLLNLLENAVEAVGEAGGIQIVTRRSLDAVLVEVIDDGKGIDSVDVSHIFEPFFSRSTEGTGLGLPICQKIIEAHHGWIKCRPNSDKGCTFTFSLPMDN